MLYEDPEGRHPVSFLGLPLVSHPVPLHQLCDLKPAPQGPASNTAAGGLGVRERSAAREGFRGGLCSGTDPHFLAGSPTTSRTLPCSSFPPCSPPRSGQCLVSETILGSEQRPPNSRGREAEKEQVTSGKHAGKRGDGPRGRGAAEGGGRAQRGGLGWGAR